MAGLVFESVLSIGVALAIIVFGVVQMRRWDRRSWQEPGDAPPTTPPANPPASP